MALIEMRKIQNNLNPRGNIMKELTEQQQDEKEMEALTDELAMEYKEEQRLHKLIRACKTLDEFSNIRSA